MVRILLLSAGLFLFAHSLAAQTPLAFRYQAAARDTDGKLLADQPLSIQLSIIRDQGSNNGTGTVVFQETHATTTNAFGLFALTIGDGTPVIGSLDAVNWATGVYFLRTSIDLTGSGNFTSLGSTPLLAVPYALHARTAEMVDDADADPGNELQQLAFDTTTRILTISEGNEVDLSSLRSGTDRDNQTLSFSGTVLTIQNGNSVNLQSLRDGVNDADANPTNEIQSISYNSDTRQLLLEPLGGAVNMDPFLTDADPANELQQLAFDPNQNLLSISDGNAINMPFATSIFERLNNTIVPTSTQLDAGFLVGATTFNNEATTPASQNRRLAFYRSLGALRVGAVRQENEVVLFPGYPNSDSWWNTDQVGEYSFAAGKRLLARGRASAALGENNIATGVGAFTAGSFNQATGSGSAALGAGNRAPAAGQLTVGLYADQPESGFDPNFWQASDPVFVIGNGSTPFNRDNALVVYKDGRTVLEGTLQLTTNENDPNSGFTFPNTRGNSGTTLVAGTAGAVSWGYPQGIAAPTGNTVRVLAESDAVRLFLQGLPRFQFLEKRLEFNNEQNGIYIGKDAGAAITSGDRNTFIGYLSGTATTSGQHNTFVGYGSGEKNQQGNFNTFIGNAAGSSNVSGSSNTLIGDNVAFALTSGSQNTALGRLAGGNLTSGGFNTLIGTEAGESLANHSSNTMIGYQAGSNSTGNNNVFVGYQAGLNETGSNKLYIHNTGSSATNALIYGEFNNRLLRLNGKVGLEKLPGNFQLDVNGDVSLGRGINATEPTSSEHLALAGRTATWYTGVENTTSAENTRFFIGRTNFPDDNFVINGKGQIGLGTSSPSSDLHLVHGNTIGNQGFRIQNEGANGYYWNIWTSNTNGDLYLFSLLGGLGSGDFVGHFEDRTGEYTSISDLRLKTDVRNLEPVLPKLMQLRPLRYRFRGQDATEPFSLGFGAQDVAPLFPELVHYAPQFDRYSLNYSGFGIIAVKAIQEQQERIEQLEKENKNLREELESMKAMLLEIRAALEK